MADLAFSNPPRLQKSAADRSWLAVAMDHWIVFFAIGYGAFVILPFLAPVFMHLGWTTAGKLIYFAYSFLCHQLPERSYFLFGDRFTHPLAEIQAAWQVTNNPMILRQFIGITFMGWKVAWSDRMVSMYTSVWVFGIIWWVLRRRIGAFPWWGFVLLALPMALDGGAHFLSDFAGIGGQGFRDTNAWLAVLTNHAFSSTFYAGDAWGSFNSMMRLLTGILFGFGLVWFSFPYIEEALRPSPQQKPF